MKRSPIPFALLGALLFLTSCADDKTPVGPSAPPTLESSSELATFPVSAELGTCGLSNAIAVRFSSPGYINGVHVGMFVKLMEMPPGAKRIRIWWDWDGAPSQHKDVTIPDDTDWETILEHRYNDAKVGDERRVRMQLLVDGQSSTECIRVRAITLKQAAPPEDPAPAPAAPALPCGDSTCTAFVTSVGTSGAIKSGALSGIAAADAFCQSLADKAGLTGTFKAWLSDASTSPATRFYKSTVPYRLPNGTKVADDWADLTDGSLDAAIEYNENNGLENQWVWTGTGTSGAPSGNSCSNWTSNGGTGLRGNGQRANSDWTVHSPSGCGNSYRLYCLEQ